MTTASESREHADQRQPADAEGRTSGAELALAATVSIGGTISVMPAFLNSPLEAGLSVPLLAHATGLLAGYGVVVLMILMARIPVLEHRVGADRLARWHAWGGRSTLVLMLTHAVAAVIGWAQATGVDVVTALADVLTFPGLIAATVGTVMFVAVGVVSARSVRRRVRYEVWHLLHLGTYMAIALSFAHELAGPDLVGAPLFQVFWSLLYSVGFGLAIRYRLLDPLLKALRHRLVVDQVVDEGNGVTSVVIRGRHLADLEAEAGQFFRWRFLTRGRWWAAHPFSLSAAPSANFLRLTVKSVGDGTAKMAALRPGIRVLAEGPYGAMTERRRTGRGVLLVAGGVGITPMRALFEDLDVDGSQLALIYRASNAEEILFREELEVIASERGAQLTYLLGRSSDPANALTPPRLKALVPDVTTRDVYICASPRFSAAAREALEGAGVPRRRIHQEAFDF